MLVNSSLCCSLAVPALYVWQGICVPKFGRLHLFIESWHFVIGWWHFVIGGGYWVMVSWSLGGGGVVLAFRLSVWWWWYLHLVLVVLHLALPFGVWARSGCVVS